MIHKLKRRLLRRLQSSLPLAISIVILTGWLILQLAPASAVSPPAIPGKVKQAPIAPNPVSSPAGELVSAAHPLPQTLAQWQDSSGQGDYFSAIQPIELGYLVWSHFPVRVYVQSAEDAVNQSVNHQPVNQSNQQPASQYERDRAQAWVTSVLQAVQDWSIYLPLEITASPEGADIQVLRSVPPLQRAASRASGRPASLPRVRSADTSYELWVDRSASPPMQAMRFTVRLSPNQTPDYTLATARHELGHALGIWGHSPTETDVMYFAQVRNPPAISVRDINTLKRIYEQPTRIGWTVEERS